MALQPGTTLGPYEVLAAIGAGGMGEVYKARDTKLDRDVALKILPDAFVNDAERLARFQREAKVLASLNHPNIAAIYDLEDEGDSPALVLEYVEGPTLQDRIAQGPIPLDEALPIARQIAGALEAAHEQGIIHRDLKPANVKVKDDGTVKVLDFGLAKALEPEQTEAEAANSPTMTMTAAATKMGVIMGTAAYMAPEQAKGRQVDKRADVWAFGVVLFEMLTGTGAFQGEDISSTLAKVIEREPDWTLIPAKTPSGIQTLLRRCLVKDRKRRIPDIGIAHIEIDDTLTGVRPTTDEAPPTVAPPAVWQRPVSVGVIALITAAVTSLVVWSLKPQTPQLPQPVTRFQITLQQDQQLTSTNRHPLALSPDGTYLAVTVNRQLYLRRLDQSEATAMSGTQGASGPFFSPDGRWIAFVQNDELKKVAVTGGAPITLAAAPGLQGGSWGSDDRILVAQSAGIAEVTGTGDSSRLLIPIEAGDGVRVRQPQMLPDGETVLFTLNSSGAGTWDDAQVVVQSLETGERRGVLEGATDARYVSTGHLLYAQQNALFAVPFDVERLEVTGGPVSLVENVEVSVFRGAAHFSTSRSGSLVYVADSLSQRRNLVWVDRTGQEEVLTAERRAYRHLQLSPDGTKLAVDIADQEQDVWIWDFARETLSRLTFDPGNDHQPVWTPDGQRIVFGTTRENFGNLYWKSASGTGTAEKLSDSLNHQDSEAFSPDGRFLLFSENDPVQGRQLRLLSLDEAGGSNTLLGTPFNERNGTVSSDGRWIAYQTDASGRNEIYVQPFPNVDDGRWQISTSGGSQPVWAPDGRELFYFSPDDGLVAVAVQTDPAFSTGTVTPLFDDGPYLSATGGGRTYDVSPIDGRFLMAKDSGNELFAGLRQIDVVLHWFEELNERVPVP